MVGGKVPFGLSTKRGQRLPELSKMYGERSEKIMMIMDMLYELIESMHYLRFGVSVIIETKNPSVKKIIAPTYYFATKKFNDDYFKLVVLIKDYFPLVWNGIRSIHSRLSAEIDKLEAYFGAEEDETVEIQSTMSRIRTQIRILWKSIILNIVLENWRAKIDVLA